MKAGSFAAVASALLLSAMAPLAAQQQVSKPPPVPPPPAPAALSVPNPFSGSAPAALSVPNPFSGLQPGPRDLYRSPDGSDRFQHLSPYPAQPTVIVPGPYFPGPYFPGPYYYPFSGQYYPFIGSQEYHRPAPAVFVARGGLVLETLPDVAQVYVDGFYVGLAEQFGLRGHALDLPSGVHHLELRAPNYETLNFSVMIAPNETIRYRGDMQALPASGPPRAIQQLVVAVPQPAVQKSFYVIPNCYAGDKPPTAALPRGCDRKNLQTRK